jgi:hypothetical protein
MNAGRALLLTVVCAAALAGEAQPLAGQAGAVAGWVPIVMPPVERGACFKAVATRYGSSLALASGGTVVAWGGSDDGDCAVPPGLSEVAGIAVGLSHMLALKSDGTVLGWGAGQPNNPSDPFGFGQSTVPAGLNGVVAVAAGTWNSVALVGGPVLTPPAPQPGGSMQLTLNGIAGWRYTVSGSTDLVNWTPLTSFVATNASTQIVEPAAGSFSHRFYRATAP